MRLKKETTMVLAVDYQEKLMPAMHNKDAFIPRTCLLLEGLKALDIPMIASEQYPKGLGSTVPEIKEVMGTVPYLPKTTFSCMDDVLRARLWKLLRVIPFCCAALSCISVCCKPPWI